MCSATQSCLALCDSMDCSPPDSSVMGFSRQESWIGLPFPAPGESSRPRGQTCISCVADRFFFFNAAGGRGATARAAPSRSPRTRAHSLLSHLLTDSLPTEPSGKSITASRKDHCNGWGNVLPKFRSTWNLSMCLYLEIESLQMFN